jgi:hypothetical protein
MRYIIDIKEKTLIIVDGTNIEEIKYLLKIFKGYRIIPKIDNDKK